MMLKPLTRNFACGGLIWTAVPGGSSIHLMAPLQEMGEGELVGLTSTHHTPPWSPLHAQLLS